MTGLVLAREHMQPDPLTPEQMNLAAWLVVETCDNPGPILACLGLDWPWHA